jgi:RHS repeat-associated protein
VLAGNRATYSDVRPGVDLVVAATRLGFAPSLVVKDRAAALAAVGLPLRAPGLHISQDAAGNLMFRDRAGATVATAAAPEMFDAAANQGGEPATRSRAGLRWVPPSPAARTDASDTAGGATEVLLTPDLTFIRDPHVTLPLTLDVTINPLGSSFDTYVKENDTVDRSGANDIQVGTYGNGVARGLVTWPITPFTGATVLSAQVNFWNWWSQSCTPASWEIWTTDPPTPPVLWPNQPRWLNREATSTQTKGHDPSCDDGWVQVDGKSFFQRAASSRTGFANLGVRAANEADTNSWKQFRSRNFVNTAVAEFAVVTYVPWPTAGATGSARNGTYTSFALTDKLTAQVNVASGNLLVESADLTLPGIGRDVTLGAAYNSLLVRTDLASGAFGPGWRTLSGRDVRVIAHQDGSVLYVAPGGNTGLFTPAGGGTYNSPGEFKATLTKTAGGWRLADHDSGATTTFDSAGVLTATADRNGNTTRFAPTVVTATRGGPGARTATILTNSAGQITAYWQTGDAGIGTRQVAYSYSNAGGPLTTITQASGRTIEFGYDGAGNLTAITVRGAAGKVEKTTFAYDGAPRVTAVRRVLDNATGAAATTRLAYPQAGRTLLAGPNTDQSRDIAVVPHTTYEVDTLTWRVTRTVDADGHSRATSYTPFADVHSATDGLNQTTLGTYTDNNGESLNSVQTPSGASLSLTYSSAAPASRFEPATGRDAQGNTTTFTYDGAGNLSQASNASAAVAAVTRNPDGTVRTSTDPGNTVSTTYVYTDHALTAIIPPPGTGLRTTTLAYDGFGRLRAVTDGRGKTTSYAYDADDRVTAVSYSDSTPAVHFTYDGFGNLTRRVDATGTTTYTFDTLNRLIARQATAGGGTEQYGYDKAGNLTSLSDARGTTTYTYDAANLQTSMTTARGTVLRYAVDGNGRRTDTWFKTNQDNSVWTMHQHTRYDASGRPARIWTARNSNDADKIQDLAYSFARAAGGSCSTPAAPDTALVQAVTDRVAGTTTVYCYDTSNRLTQAVISGARTQTVTYTYDARGNRLTAADGTRTQSLAYDAANQITTSGYGYDAAGNQTRDPAVGTLTYNAAGQLTRAGATTYQYAGPDQRELTRQVGNGTTVSYTYGRTDQYGNPLVQSIRRSGASGAVYLDHDAVGTPQVLTTDTGAEHFYVLDDLGSPLALVNTHGTTVAAYTYDPYGVFTDSGGTTAAQNPYRFAIAGVADPSTRLIKYGQRWYNPALGRFTQPDSIVRLADPDNGNRYAYAGDDPINNIDPTGRSCRTSLGLAIGSFLIFEGAVLTTPATGVTALVAIGSYIVFAASAADAIEECGWDNG